MLRKGAEICESRGQSPWGSGAPEPSEWEESLRRFKNHIPNLPAGYSGGASLVVLFVLLVFGAKLALDAIYTVQPNEIALNLVFGHYQSRAAPGLHWNWPEPIGHVIKVPVQDQQITEVGYRGDNRGDIESESLMLTGDQNIVQVHFRVNWRIDSNRVEDYVFNVRDPKETVKSVAESIMREVVGQKTIDGILTSDRASMEPDAQKRMQEVVDTYKMGVRIEQVQLQMLDAPPEVVAAYRDVTAAQQDQQTLINNAETYANKIKPEAEGEAAQIIAEAEAYKKQSVLEAIGQAARYQQVYTQYKKSPIVTRERIYLETIEKALSKMQKTLLDTKSGSALMPYIAVEPPSSGGSVK